MLRASATRLAGSPSPVARRFRVRERPHQRECNGKKGETAVERRAREAPCARDIEDKNRDECGHDHGDGHGKRAAARGDARVVASHGVERRYGRVSVARPEDGEIEGQVDEEDDDEEACTSDSKFGDHGARIERACARAQTVASPAVPKIL